MFMIAMKSWPCLRWKNWQWWWLMIIMMLKWITCYRWAFNCFFASPFRLFSFFLGVSSSLAIRFDRLAQYAVRRRWPTSQPCAAVTLRNTHTLTRKYDNGEVGALPNEPYCNGQFTENFWTWSIILWILDFANPDENVVSCGKGDCCGMLKEYFIT